MILVLLVGNGAVGKMTVGQELMKLTDLRLFHNHMTIEPVLEIFGTFNGEGDARHLHFIPHAVKPIKGIEKSSFRP